MRQAVHDQRYELGFLGAPYHAYLLEDLANMPVDPYKLVLFLNVTHLGEDQLDLIRRRFCRDQRTIVWCGLDQVPAVPGPTGFAGSRRAAAAPETSADAGSDDTRVYLLKSQDQQPALQAVITGSQTQILSPLPCLPAARLRELAIQAGVHIYCHSGEVIYASREFIAIHAATAGVKRVYLPEPGDAGWVIGQGKPIRNVPYFDIPMEQGETLMWQIRALAGI